MATIPDDPSELDPMPAYLELDVMENGLRTDLASTPFELKKGIMAIPDRPGLGVELDENALRRYASK
jgi:D-galactarolactone cycloisomerase